jgi:hypothetical protein
MAAHERAWLPASGEPMTSTIEVATRANEMRKWHPEIPSLQSPLVTAIAKQPRWTIMGRATSQRQRSCWGSEMLSLPTESFRVEAAVALAALYAFCLLLPAAAFAIADGRMAPPCLIDELATLSMRDHGVMPVPSEAMHHHAGAPDARVEAMPTTMPMAVMCMTPRLQKVPTVERAAPGNAADCFRWGHSLASFACPRAVAADFDRHPRDDRCHERPRPGPHNPPPGACSRDL